MKKILQPTSFLLIVLSIVALSCKKDGDPPVIPEIPEEVYEPEISAGAGVTDLDGQVYGSVVIGNQEWMTENLRTTQYSNGDPIPLGPGAGGVQQRTDRRNQSARCEVPRRSRAGRSLASHRDPGASAPHAVIKIVGETNHAREEKQGRPSIHPGRGRGTRLTRRGVARDCNGAGDLVVVRSHHQ